MTAVGTIEGKVWGTTQLLFRTSNVELHRIVARAGGYCSRHTHRSKFNFFYVERGRLQIETCKAGLDDQVELGAGQFTTVAPGVPHRFRALEETVALELYWVELDPNDIQRSDHGGMQAALPAAGILHHLQLASSDTAKVRGRPAA